MANPRATAMARLREKEALARQAAMLGAEKKKGIMSSLPTSLNNIGQFISDDNNDLDDVSFSTLDGLKASFKNNRTKDSVPKINVSPRVAAMTAMREKSAMQEENTRAVASDDAKRFSALNSFIETNSAGPKPAPEGSHYMPDGSLMSDADMGQYNQSGQSMDGSNSLLDGNLRNRNTDLALEAYERDNEIQKQKELAQFQGDASRVPEAGSVMQPRWDGSVDQNANFQMPTEGSEAVKEAAIRTGMSQEELDDLMLYQNQINSVTPDSMGPQAKQEEASELFDEGAAVAYYPDGSPMTLDEYIGASQADLMDSAETKETIKKKLLAPFSEDPYYIEESGYANKNNQGNLAITDQNRADAISTILEDYNTRDVMNFQDLAKSNPEINAALLDGTLSMPAGRGDPFEDKQFTDEGYDGFGVDSIDQSLDGSNYDELLMEEGLAESMDNNAEDIVEDTIVEDNVDMDQGMLEDEVQTQTPIQSLDGSNYDELVGEVTSDEKVENAGVDLANEQDVAEFKEKAEVKVATEVIDATDPSIKTTVDEVITTSQENGDSQEETESKLSELFGGLKDVFGVDNKSLLRAFVKYVGGRVFGLSSGKAANFAWAGIEQDMATNTAKGAEARKYADNMAAYKSQYDAAFKAKDFDTAKMIMQKMNDESGVDKSDPEKYYEGLEFLQNKKAELMASSDPKDKELIKAIDDQINKWETAGIDGSTTPTSIYDLEVQDENGNTRKLNARDGANGREVQMPNGKFVPLKDYKSEGFGTVMHAGKLNSSGAGATPFKMAGKRYNADTDSEFEAQLESVDKKVEEGTMSEEQAFNERSKIQNSNNNRNSDGELYEKKIPYAESISNSGVAFFPPQKDAAQKASYQLAEGARGLAKLETIQSSPKAMAMVNKWTAKWQSIANTKAMSYGQISSYIAQNFSANPLQQAYYMGMLELTTSKLRRDTGAAYNMKEMMDTMERYTNFKDTSADVTGMKLSNAKLDLEAIAGNTRSGPYWLGVLDGTYRPSDSWQGTIGSIYNMMEDAGAYSISGPEGSDGNGRDIDSEYSEV